MSDRMGKITYTRTRTCRLDYAALREKRIVTGSNERDGFSTAFKILRTQVLQRMRRNNWNALAVTSPAEGEGKTLVSINLAISLAMEVDQTVLLVDADLRRPSVHACLGLPPGPGLSDYLTRDVPVEDILINPGMAGFVILPGGEPLANSSEMLGSRKMAELVQELKNRYPSRIVLFDVPSLLSAADALAFSPYVDAALLVVEEGKTGRDDVVRAEQLLGGTQLIGTVLNKSRVPVLANSGGMAQERVVSQSAGAAAIRTPSRLWHFGRRR